MDSLERFEGALNLDVSFDGNIRNIKNYTGQDFAKTKTQGDLTIQNGSIKFKGAKQQFNDLSAALLFNNNDVVVNCVVVVGNERRKGNRTPYRFAAGSIWASAAVAQEVAATDRN